MLVIGCKSEGLQRDQDGDAALIKGERRDVEGLVFADSWVSEFIIPNRLIHSVAIADALQKR